MRIFAPKHDDNSHSENPQPDPVLVETGSNVTLTCHAAQKSTIDWYVNKEYREVRNCKNVETCNLTLRWPVVRGNYSCRASYNSKCLNSKVLELKVAGESRVIQLFVPIIIIIIIIIIITSDTGKSKL